MSLHYIKSRANDKICAMCDFYKNSIFIRILMKPRFTTDLMQMTNRKYKLEKLLLCLIDGTIPR